MTVRVGAACACESVLVNDNSQTAALGQLAGVPGLNVERMCAFSFVIIVLLHL